MIGPSRAGCAPARPALQVYAVTNLPFQVGVNASLRYTMRRPGGRSRLDFGQQRAANAPAGLRVGAAGLAVGVATRTARTLATIWWASFPAATDERIAPKTFPASSTVQGGRCANCAGWDAPPNGSSLV